MLQQILNDLWVDPELLAELDENMKQTLFCKMREEQVRRWEAWDRKQWDKTLQIECEGEKKKGTKVQFLMGEDGEPWVWVMGDHPNDKSIEDILEEEAKEKARQQAEKETEELRKNVAVELTGLLDLTQNQIQKFEKVSEKLRDENESLDLYCTVNEIREKTTNTMSQTLKQSEELEIDFQEIFINRPQKVAQQIAQWEQRLLEKRTSQIFQRLKNQRKETEKQAEEAEHQQENLWREQEKRAKEAEFQIREIARRAREEHRKTIHGNCSDTEPVQQESANVSLPLVSSENENSSNFGLGKPSSRVAVLEWFQKNEIPRRAGLDSSYQVERWFHGLITRAEAETLMNEKPSGTFLVRVSEKIWGYAITYRENGKCKHYLVDASTKYYKFLGANHVCHKTLSELVDYHRKKPITLTGREILRFECHRSGIPAIYKGVSGVTE